MIKEVNEFWADDKKFCIRIAGNTGPRSLMAIRSKGYDILYYTEERVDVETGEKSYLDCYDAKKDGRYFSASTPQELLGLIALWEVRGDFWRKVTDEEWAFYNDLNDQSRIYDEDGNDVTEV